MAGELRRQRPEDEAQVEKQWIPRHRVRGKTDSGGHCHAAAVGAADQALSEAHHTTGSQIRPHAASVS